jgi:PIN domain nuclease of toxin-antitoxin system
MAVERPREGRMRLLLDTHVFLWWRTNRVMRPDAMEAIRSANEVFVSAASAWEVAINAAAGKLRLDAVFADGVAASGFEPLPIDFQHAAVAAELPPHHRDPFDRMLVAQARVERLTLVTHDRQLEPYGGVIVWA